MLALGKKEKKKKKSYWPVQMNANKFATGQFMGKTGRKL